MTKETNGSTGSALWNAFVCCLLLGAASRSPRGMFSRDDLLCKAESKACFCPDCFWHHLCRQLEFKWETNWLGNQEREGTQFRETTINKCWLARGWDGACTSQQGYELAQNVWIKRLSTAQIKWLLWNRALFSGSWQLILLDLLLLFFNHIFCTNKQSQHCTISVF